MSAPGIGSQCEALRATFVAQGTSPQESTRWNRGRGSRGGNTSHPATLRRATSEEFLLLLVIEKSQSPWRLIGLSRPLTGEDGDGYGDQGTAGDDGDCQGN